MLWISTVRVPRTHVNKGEPTVSQPYEAGDWLAPAPVTPQELDDMYPTRGMVGYITPSDGLQVPEHFRHLPYLDDNVPSVTVPADWHEAL